MGVSPHGVPTTLHSLDGRKQLMQSWMHRSAGCPSVGCPSVRCCVGGFWQAPAHDSWSQACRGNIGGRCAGGRSRLLGGSAVCVLTLARTQLPTLQSRQHGSTLGLFIGHWQLVRQRLWQRCSDWCTGTQHNVVVVVVEQIEEECTRQLEQINTNMQDTSTTLNQAQCIHTASTSHLARHAQSSLAACRQMLLTASLMQY